MRVVESTATDDASDSDDRSDVLEIHPQRKEDQHAVNDHTEEYWKSTKPIDKSKADWVKDEEDLSTEHIASESFAVLNELVVVFPEENGSDFRIVDRIRF
jgi:hypothetical protein